MKLPFTDKSKFLVLLAFIFLGIFSLSLSAQEKDDSKFDQLKGKVEKITVKVDGKEVVFDGKDAEKLADRLKSEKKIRIFTHGDLKEMNDGEGKVVVFKSRKGDSDIDEKQDNVKKKINVEVKDGKKVVTVTTIKDGKEETKTYEGESADKFISDEKEGKNISVVVADGENDGKENVFYFNRKVGGGKMGMRSGYCCCGSCGMDESKMSGKGTHKMMMMKKMNDDNTDVIIEKKVEGKEEKKK